jgi:hypothetical protein
MDTKYFQQALAEYCAKHPWDSATPLTASQLSKLLTRAQELKDADRKKTQPEPEPAV